MMAAAVTARRGGVASDRPDRHAPGSATTGRFPSTGFGLAVLLVTIPMFAGMVVGELRGADFTEGEFMIPALAGQVALLVRTLALRLRRWWWRRTARPF
jgi:hypothetical protein